MKKETKDTTVATTDKIKKAAHDLFLQKGFASTTIREIAVAAGTNVALLNYHFGSKKNLFEVVMLEKIQQLLSKLMPVLSDKKTSLEQKIEGVTDSYIDFLLGNPDLPIFILNEIRKNNFDFIKKTQLGELVHRSFFMKQLKSATGDINPIQFLLSIVAMILFPFVASPVILQTGLAEKSEFQQLMLERKKLIPTWAKSMLSQNI